MRNGQSSFTSKEEHRLSEKQLTFTEVQILELVALGDSSKEIAAKRGCSVRTIDWTLNNIYQKLSVNNRIKAVNVARALGAIN